MNDNNKDIEQHELDLIRMRKMKALIESQKRNHQTFGLFQILYNSQLQHDPSLIDQRVQCCFAKSLGLIPYIYFLLMLLQMSGEYHLTVLDGSQPQLLYYNRSGFLLRFLSILPGNPLLQPIAQGYHF